jgi:hypothetical protein
MLMPPFRQFKRLLIDAGHKRRTLLIAYREKMKQAVKVLEQKTNYTGS